jgi:hypothetical protein
MKVAWKPGDVWVEFENAQNERLYREVLAERPDSQRIQLESRLVAVRDVAYEHAIGMHIEGIYRVDVVMYEKEIVAMLKPATKTIGQDQVLGSDLIFVGVRLRDMPTEDVKEVMRAAFALAVLIYLPPTEAGVQGKQPRIVEIHARSRR